MEINGRWMPPAGPDYVRDFEHPKHNFEERVRFRMRKHSMSRQDAEILIRSVIMGMEDGEYEFDGGSVEHGRTSAGARAKASSEPRHAHEESSEGGEDEVCLW